MVSSRPSLLRVRSLLAISRTRRAAARRRSVMTVAGAPPAACTRRAVRTSLPDGLGQQPRVGRVGHIRRDHRGVGPHPGGAQQLLPGGLGPQRLIQPGHRLLPAPGGQLHQRGRVRHLAIQRDPAKPPPGDRIGHLGAQALIAQPVAELEEHQPQIALHRRRWPAEHRVEVRRERGEERRVIQQRVHPRQLLRQPQHLRRKNDSHNEGRSPMVRNMMTSIPSSPRGRGHPSPRDQGSPSGEFFRSK